LELPLLISRTASNKCYTANYQAEEEEAEEEAEEERLLAHLMPTCPSNPLNQSKM